MSDRITSEWTEDTIGAFGDTPKVRKGILAEKLFYDYAIKVYDQVIDHSKEKNNQVRGCDFSIKRNTWKNFYGVDVKSNFYANGTFYIENESQGWLRNPNKKCDRIFHICAETGWGIEYDRKSMIQYIDTHQIKSDKDGLVLLSSFDKSLNGILKKYKVR
jgi:hypothetical protein